MTDQIKYPGVLAGAVKSSVRAQTVTFDQQNRPDFEDRTTH